MKKKSSKSKRRWIVGGAVLFGGVALLTTGFATWVIGVQRNAIDNDVSVEVDTAKNESVILTAALAGGDPKIVLAESEEISGTNNIIAYEADNITTSTPEDGLVVGVDPDGMYITFSELSVTVGKQATAPTGIGFELKYIADTGDNAVTTNVKDNAKTLVKESLIGSGFRTVAATTGTVETTGDTDPYWTYIEAPNDITFVTEDGADKNTTLDTTGASTNTYTVDNPTVKFNWGTFFNKVSPANFYNEVFRETVTNASSDIDWDNIVTYQNQIYTELNTMYSVLNGATLVLSVTVL